MEALVTVFEQLALLVALLSICLWAGFLALAAIGTTVRSGNYLFREVTSRLHSPVSRQLTGQSG